MRTSLLAAVGVAAALVAPAAAHAQNPLSSLFSCNNAGNRQQQGAIAGALLGGILGNQINDNDRTTGTVVGGLLGLAAGSAIGCNMSGDDTARATDATRRALAENRSTTWSARDGSSGRIDIVDTFRQADASARAYDNGYDNRYDDRYGARSPNGYDDRYGVRGPTSLSDVRFAPGVQYPSNYDLNASRYQTTNRTNVRAAPYSSARVVYQLRRGETFDSVARVGGGWLLATRNGEAIGYVAESVVARVDSYGDAYASRRNDPYTGGQLCRTFDQTVQRPGYSVTTERFTACQNARGEWVLEG